MIRKVDGGFSIRTDDDEREVGRVSIEGSRIGWEIYNLADRGLGLARLALLGVLPLVSAPLFACILPINIPSRRLALRAGFRRDCSDPHAHRSKDGDGWSYITYKWSG
jgi:RimJ/RimL family protein N-acetyltransferase